MRSRSSAPFGSKFYFLFFRSHVYPPPIPPQREGRTRGRHETRGGEAVDVSGCSVALASADEQSRCGREVVWSWSPDAEAKPAVECESTCAGDGGKTAGPQGEHEASVKTIAQGRLGSSGCTCGSLPRALLFARGPWASADAQPSLRPSPCRGAWSMHDPGVIRRGSAKPCLSLLNVNRTRRTRGAVGWAKRRRQATRAHHHPT
jgi:hypothetical protein